MLAISVFAGVKITDTSTGKTASGATIWDAVSAFLSGGNRVTGRAVGGQMLPPPPGCTADTFTWSPISPVPTTSEIPLSGTATGASPTTDIKIGAVTGQMTCMFKGPGIEILDQDGYLIATASCSAPGLQPIELIDANSAQVKLGTTLKVTATETGGEQNVELTAGSLELITCSTGCAEDNINCATDANCNVGFQCWGGPTSTPICTGFCTAGTLTQSDDGVDCTNCEKRDLTKLADFDQTFVGTRKFGTRIASTEVINYGSDGFHDKDFKTLFKRMAALLNSESQFGQVSGAVVFTNDGVRTVADTWLHSETVTDENGNGDPGSGLGQDLLSPEPEEEEKICVDYRSCDNGKKSAKLCGSTSCKTVADCFNKGVDPNVKVPKSNAQFQQRDKLNQKSGRPVSIGLTKCESNAGCTPKTSGIVDCANSPSP